MVRFIPAPKAIATVSTLVASGVFVDKFYNNKHQMSVAQMSCVETLAFQAVNLHVAAKEKVIYDIKTLASFTPPKNPIILCHGLSGFDTLIVLPNFFRFLARTAKELTEDDTQHHALLEFEYWIGVKEALEAKGCTVITAKVSPFGSIDQRARALNEFIERETSRLKQKPKSSVYTYSTSEKLAGGSSGDEEIKVNLIAHSMGGLDCRYLISQIPNKNFKVVSLTTIATPHHGSEVADFVVKHTPLKLPPAFYQLTTNYMRKFNEKVKNDDDVRYFSYAAFFSPEWYNVFLPSWYILAKAGKPLNDGMVSVESAKWGTYVGALHDIDHLDLINWQNALKRKLKISPGKNVLEFYLTIADNLAREGY